MRSRAPPGGGLSSTRSSSTKRLTSCPEGRPGSRPPREKPPYLWGGGVRGEQVEARERGAGKPPSGQAEAWEWDPPHLTSFTHFLVFRLWDRQTERRRPA